MAQSALDAEQLALTSGNSSDQGGQQVKAATDEMTRIAQSVSDTAEQMTTLAEQSPQISSIANVIKEVADQTNLLALNAAIEAARGQAHYFASGLRQNDRTRRATVKT